VGVGCHFKKMREFEKLNTELKNLGLKSGHFLEASLSPIETLVNSNVSAKPYLRILISYLPKLTGKEQEMVVRALSEKGMNMASLELFKLLETSKVGNDNNFWAICNAISIIDDKESYEQVLKICQNTELGIARQMLMATLRKMKTEESFQALVSALKDETIKGHAIEELGKLGDKRALDILKNTTAAKGKYEFKEKEKAIKRLTSLT
jgi:HEAT repeat protein